MSKKYPTGNTNRNEPPTMVCISLTFPQASIPIVKPIVA